ncbi:MAG: hypothetical protein JNG88_17970 [Phycisphaerales bacterium]|nr:hypothetical protein [Phycisphaerales bacterium]
MKRCLLGAAIPIALMIGCHDPNARLNAPPHGEEPTATNEMQGTYAYMQDAALLADMSISDMHFFPHRALLTSLGEQRLSRLALLVGEYGGSIRLSTDLGDSALINKRVDAVVAFLTEAGLEMTPQTVVQDVPGGRGLPAAEVLLIRANEGTYKVKKSSGPSTLSIPLAGGGDQQGSNGGK